MKNSTTIIKVIVIAVLVIASSAAIAQTGGPGPADPTGVPIDGISGLLMMAVAAIFGKKFIGKDKK